MNCELCKEHKAVYKYKLIDGKEVDICSRCGEILWQTYLEYYDRLSQICVMIDYTEHRKVLTNKENFDKIDIESRRLDGKRK